MAQVIVRNASYNYDQLREVFFEMVESLAGDKIKPGSRVLIKPNLLIASTPADAITTHPFVVKAAVEYVLKKGARPQVSDSPAIGSFERILKVSGIKDALSGLDVVCKPFKETHKADIGLPYGAIDIALDALEADAIINLPKLKTHNQMRLTLSVKNMFGSIIGFKKAQWHMRAGVDTLSFARLLVSIHQKVKPTISILDGILALEGEGPGKSGKPREIGILMGSCDSFSLDLAVCKMIGVNYESVPILKVAKDDNLITDYEIDGQLLIIKGFQLPGMGEIVFGPQALRNFLRRHSMQQPVCNEQLCKLCGKCWTICPAKAVRAQETSVNFNYDECIHCYCCIEVCPEAAIKLKETGFGKIIRKFVDKFS